MLETIGLSKAEEQIYIALLHLGPSQAGAIIQKTELQSSVAHRALNSLAQKGLASYIIVGKNRTYQAAPPKAFWGILENKKNAPETVLPKLERIRADAPASYLAEMFVGKRAIFRSLESLIADAKAGEPYYSFSLIESHSDPDIWRFYHRFTKLRASKKLSIKVMVNRKAKPFFEKYYPKSILRKIRTRYTSFSFPQGIIIFRNTVCFLSWTEPPTIVHIKNPSMAEQFRAFFLDFYEKEKNAY